MYNSIFQPSMAELINLYNTIFCDEEAAFAFLVTIRAFLEEKVWTCSRTCNLQKIETVRVPIYSAV